ncbi:MAG: DUF3098 domain-containing protein [Lewinellaceae bacterium]|nr:DUF3098 domain-containing protein [Saprospiraceae bacterium]MCB9311767.1 DUF3098 domain-containing protein [Lewinellaceae bacterium]HRW76528.1 DUF3098 domain-containing protein [Saprospiraceae bacterium]
MSANTPPKKKVVVTGSKKPAVPSSRAQRTETGTSGESLLYGRTHYLLMGTGVLVIILGLILMSGGSMPDPDTWDESVIYSGRRTILAPMVILAGLGIEIYAIFKKS